ncbi:MAG: methyltransferase domain-containing protein [Methanobrevibacter sp.]|nr:methyltransferase domain-containing protein [Methanobrevibacter sp.]
MEYDENETDPLGEIPNFCPICGTSSIFETHGVSQRFRVKCPNCSSVERIRFQYLIFEKRFFSKFEKPCKLLHFAPEQAFYEIFMSFENIDYYPVDLNPSYFERRGRHIVKKVNMEDIPYDDKEFDFIFNSHVLEHVPNYLKAMSELYRVLKDDGTCIVAVPIYEIPETFEKEEYNTPELRLKYYGQEDHLRKYGLDFKDLLESVGFNVEVIKTQDIIDNYFEQKLISINRQYLFICTK